MIPHRKDQVMLVIVKPMVMHPLAGLGEHTPWVHLLAINKLLVAPGVGGSDLCR